MKSPRLVQQCDGLGFTGPPSSLNCCSSLRAHKSSREALGSRRVYTGYVYVPPSLADPYRCWKKMKKPARGNGGGHDVGDDGNDHPGGMMAISIMMITTTKVVDDTSVD